jgi:hypothetical protein
MAPVEVHLEHLLAGVPGGKVLADDPEAAVALIV